MIIVSIGLDGITDLISEHDQMAIKGSEFNGLVI